MEDIRLENLCCGYGSEIILKNVSFSVYPGEFLSLVGPNGAGKTTLLRAVTGLLPVSGGHIFVRGTDICRMDGRTRAKLMAVVSQFERADSMTVEDYVLMGRYPYRSPFSFFDSSRDFKIAEEALKICGIFSKRMRYMNNLSGGERQLAALARAFAQQTDIVILDEPTAHLDIGHKVKILDLIRKMNEEKGITVILVIHDLNLAADYSDRVLLLKKGLLYSEGTPEEVITEKNIEEVYETEILSVLNPVTGRNIVLPKTNIYR